jgi:hypothetical protein
MLKDMSMNWDELWKSVSTNWENLFKDLSKSWEKMFEKMPDEWKKTLDKVGRVFVDAIKGWIKTLTGGASGGEQGGTLGQWANQLGFQAGTDFVPRTGPALLHQGEAVIPAGENARGGGRGGNITVNFNNPSFQNQGDMDRFAQMLVDVLGRNRRGAATSTRRVLGLA